MTEQGISANVDKRWRRGRKRWIQLDDCWGVYIAGHGDYAKIGWSTRVGYRLRAIEEGLPSPLRLYAMIESPVATMLETALHRRFAAQRAWGEWFQFSGPRILSVMTWI